MKKIKVEECNLIKNKINLKLSLEEYVEEDAPIGTRVETKNDIYIKIDKDKYYDMYCKYIIDSDEVFKYDKIVNVLPPHYDLKLSKKEILDKQEKEYLRNIIKPFRNRIRGIAKGCCHYICEEYIVIIIKNADNIVFPSFKDNTMYAGMELNKEYTLEELGL